MQGKGIIKFFLVVMALVCLMQVLFYLPTRGVEKNADEHAFALSDDDASPEWKKARADYLDSMSSEKIWRIPLLKDFTYQELKSRQLALGLDLKGGMSVVLQVDLREFIRTLANDSTDPPFTAALENAKKAQANSQSDFVTLFYDEYSKIENARPLAELFQQNPSFQGKINFETSDREIISLIREKANETVSLTHDRLKNRIDELGVVQPNVSLDAAKDLITVELPGISNPERARKFLTAAAKLEFWNVYRVGDTGILQSFVEADKRLAKIQSGDTSLEEPDEPEFTLTDRTEYKYDDAGNISDSTIVQDTVFTTDAAQGAQGPLMSLLQLNTGSYSPAVMGIAPKNKIKEIDKLLANDALKGVFKNDVILRWAYKPLDYIEDLDVPMYELYAIKKDRGREKAPLEGDRVTDASANPDPQTGEIQISLSMDPEGARIWGDMTTKASIDNKRPIAILLDNKVVSAPNVQSAITSGRSSISGNFTVQDGNDLAKILQIGKLPAEAQIIQEQLVGPSLGKKNIKASITSLLIGFALVFIFMAIYYSTGGFIAILALLLNVFFIFGALASYGTVLTLPGIAGIVLTIGMAVDANVIIFERIREELREGKSLLSSIQDGFSHSYSAIIDANVTTLLTAMILAYFGLGPIKGFAVVLIIGVLSSLFTAVLVGKLMIDYWTKTKGNDMSFWTNFSKNAFANVNIDWLGKRKMAYTFSGIIMVIGLAAFAVRGFELGVDFEGGYSYDVQFDESANVTADNLRKSLEADDVFGATPIVKSVSTNNTYNVTTSYLINDDSNEAANLVMNALHKGVNKMLGGNVDIKNFKNPDFRGTHVTSSSKIGPTIADDIKTSAFYAAIFALLAIFLYIFLRFNKWQYSAGAVAALFHDTIFVLAIFSIFHGIFPFSLEINQAFIAAILTVIGYSINDTVVVFDRIREYMNDYTQKSKHEVINMAVNSTISRTVITSLTTLFVVLILFIFGGSSIKGFAFALVVGILVGTYSSVFIATPIMSDLTGEIEPKEQKKKSFSRAAKAR